MQSMVVKLVVVLAVLLGSHWMAYEHGKKATSQQIEQAYRDYKKKLDDAVNEYDVRVEQVVKEKDEQIANINDVLAASLKRLQHRPSRPQIITETREITIPCTGRELYKEDGEFLTREAARAERVLAERNYYSQRYEEARLMLERLNNE